MPHTSHKKKQTRNKRQEVVGDDGWTRVTSNKPLPMAKGLTSWKLLAERVEEAPEGLTQSEVLAKYIDVEKRWKASESWKSIENTLKTRVIGSDTRMDACVLFGSGTFTGLGLGWIDRGHVAMYQLAVFKAVVDLIGNLPIT
jgi:hypothetical protein